MDYLQLHQPECFPLPRWGNNRNNIQAGIEGFQVLECLGIIQGTLSDDLSLQIGEGETASVPGWGIFKGYC